MYADPFYRKNPQAITKGRYSAIGFRDDVGIVPYRRIRYSSTKLRCAVIGLLSRSICMNVYVSAPISHTDCKICKSILLFGKFIQL